MSNKLIDLIESLKRYDKSLMSRQATNSSIDLFYAGEENCLSIVFMEIERIFKEELEGIDIFEGHFDDT